MEKDRGAIEEAEKKHVDELTEGMVLARTIYTSSMVRLFMSGKTLDSSAIEMLKKWNIEEAYVQIESKSGN